MTTRWDTTMPDTRKARLGLTDTLRGIAWVLRFVATTPSMARHDVEARVLSHLAAHGRTRGYDLYLLFEEGNDLHVDGHAGPGAPGYVSLGLLHVVLSRLEDAGEVRRDVEEMRGRRHAYWRLDPWGGTRKRARGAAPARSVPSAPGLAVAFAGARQ